MDGDAPADELAVGEVVDAVLVDEDDELEHAVAITAIGIRAAAVQAKRILMATGGYSFVRCTLLRALVSSHAGACEQRTALPRGRACKISVLGVSRTGH
jgi:succinate dehydrogenase/fumarate reductase flavoprotein subunit